MFQRCALRFGERNYNPKVITMSENQYIISLGGSLIVPDEIDVIFLKKFKRLILEDTENDEKMDRRCADILVLVRKIHPSLALE